MIDEQMTDLGLDTVDDEQLLDDEQQQLYEHYRLVADSGQVPLRVVCCMCSVRNLSMRSGS